jgi:hypothetical protein
MLNRFFYALSRIVTNDPGKLSGSETVTLERTVHSPDGRHRVCFFRRQEDGVCGFREELYDDKLAEAHWRPVRDGLIEEYKDMNAAVAAAKAAVLWLHLVMR